jgi:hypothetical protein
MAFNPSPKVAMARDYANKFSKKQVIILAIDDNETLEYASYGTTKLYCHNAEILADIAYDALMEYWR